MGVENLDIRRLDGDIEVAAGTVELSPTEEEMRTHAISAIMEMDIQDVVKYLSYIKGGKI